MTRGTLFIVLLVMCLVNSEEWLGFLSRSSPVWGYFTPPMLHQGPYQLEQTPMEHMVDITNALGVATLQDHAYTKGNFAFSPYGMASVLVVLYEGARGESARQIQRTMNFPSDKDIIRVGFRDIHRRLRSYFSHEGFLSGITLNKESSNLKSDFKLVLKFYGYDIDLPSQDDNIPTEEIVTLSSVNSSLISTASDGNSTMIFKNSSAASNEEPKSSSVHMTDTTTPITEDLYTTSRNDEKGDEIDESATAESIMDIDTSKEPTAEISTTTTQENISTITTNSGIDTDVPSTVAVATTTETSEYGKTTVESGMHLLENVSHEAHTATPVEENFTEAFSEMESKAPTSSAATETVTDVPTETKEPSNDETTEAEQQEETAGSNLDNGMLIPPSTYFETTIRHSANDLASFTPETTFRTTTAEAYENSSEQTGKEEITEASDTKSQTTLKENENIVSKLTMEPTSQTEFLQVPTKDSGDRTTQKSIVETTIGEKEASEKSLENASNPSEKAFAPVTFLNESQSENENVKLLKNNLKKNYSKQKRSYSSKNRRCLTQISRETKSYRLISEPKDKLLKRFSGFRKKRTISDFSRSFLGPDLSLQLQNGMYDTHISRNANLYRNLPRRLFLVDGAVDTPVPMMTYTNIFPYGYIPRLHSKALEFPLDDVRYKLLILLPLERRGLRQLLHDLGSCSLREVIDTVRPTRVRTTIPTFMVEGFVILTSTLQKLGIWDVFDPRKSNLSGMSFDPELYVRNVEQSVTVVIRNYVEILDIQTRTMAARQVFHEFEATHPFVYFVLDTATNVALMAGQMLDPLNSRIY